MPTYHCVVGDNLQYLRYTYPLNNSPFRGSFCEDDLSNPLGYVLQVTYAVNPMRVVGMQEPNTSLLGGGISKQP